MFATLNFVVLRSPVQLALITISIIAEWSTPMNKDNLLKKLLQPRDGSRVILRKFAKNICICMHLNGTVYTEVCNYLIMKLPQYILVI